MGFLACSTLIRLLSIVILGRLDYYRCKVSNLFDLLAFYHSMLLLLSVPLPLSVPVVF